jgi:hypothetical protein
VVIPPPEWVPQPQPTLVPTKPASTAPKVRAFKSAGAIGGFAQLRVSTRASSPYRWYEVEVVAGGRVIGLVTSPVRTRGSIQQIKWRVPRTMRPQTLRFCVVGYDNKVESADACASLVVSRLLSRKQ